METDPTVAQFNFVLEADKLKTVVRNTLLSDKSRFENAAEHSWHVALAAMVFIDSAQSKGMNLTRILEMLLVHDLVEIDAGDLLCYRTDQMAAQKEKEHRAAERIFGLLSGDRGEELRRLWQEFEANETPEAQYANAVDRLQPLLQAFRTKGETWRQHGIHREQVIRRMLPIRAALPQLWEHVMDMIDHAAEAGWLAR